MPLSVFRNMFCLVFFFLDPTPPDGITQTLTACEVGFFDDCSNSYEIDVKNCSTFLVYKLIPMDVCNAAYCFGNNFALFYNCHGLNKRNIDIISCFNLLLFL